MSAEKSQLALWTQRELIRCGAIIENGHFIGTKGEHLDTYVTKDAVAAEPPLMNMFARAMAENLRGKGIETVVGPAVGAIVPAFAVALNLCWLEPNRRISFAYAEKDGEDFAFRRGFSDKVRERRIALVEDTLNSGGSALAMVRACELLQADIALVHAMVNRGGVTSEMVGGKPLTSLLDLPLRKWAAQDCPMCKDGVPINTEYGKGKLA